MKVLIISDLQAAGGAAIACQRLKKSLLERGEVSVVHAVRYLAEKDNHPDTFELANSLRLQSAANRLEQWSLHSLTNSLRTYGLKEVIAKAIQTHSPDIINIHNLHGAKDWDVNVVELCARLRPVTWTLHDMWSFTGSCAYAGDCKQYTQGCQSDCRCPDAIPKLPQPRLATAWEKRKRLFKRYPNLVAICPSQWLADQATQGLWKENPVKVIPNSLPLDIFKPSDSEAVRKKWNIPADSPVLLAIADSLSDKRKGMHLLKTALEKLKHRPITLLTVGRDPLDWKIDGIHLHHLGYVSTDSERASTYQAADLLIHPALEDNLPNTIAESSACGTPTVAFATGGIPEMIQPNQTGWLAPERTAESLADSLTRALNAISENSTQIASSCRAFAQERYAPETQAEQYVQLFQSLCDSKA